MEKFGIVVVSVVIGLLPCMAMGAPLSCEMKETLVVLSAKMRDAGKTRAEVQKVMLDAGDVTRDEVRAVLNVSFNEGMKNIDPEKMGRIAYDVCVGAKK